VGIFICIWNKQADQPHTLTREKKEDLGEEGEREVEVQLTMGLAEEKATMVSVSVGGGVAVTTSTSGSMQRRWTSRRWQRLPLDRIRDSRCGCGGGSKTTFLEAPGPHLLFISGVRRGPTNQEYG
jgi:hypothetical protein